MTTREAMKTREERDRSSGRHMTILLVEDDPGHAHLIEKNLRRGGCESEIIRLGDGQQAVDFLQGGDVEGTSVREPLMILDLNLPVLDGYQVLRMLKKDERTRQIPIVVLSTSDNPGEVAQCYEMGCNLYVTKPVEYERFCDTIRLLGAFFCVINVPEKESSAL